MANLNAGRGGFFASLQDTFLLSDTTANFLKQIGVVIFHKDPATNSVKSYQHGRALNSLTNIEKFKTYQIDNKSNTALTFPNRFAGFGLLPDLTGVGSSSPSPTPTPNPPVGTGNRVAIPVGTYRRKWEGNSITDTLMDANATAGLDAIFASQGFTDQWARTMIPGAPLAYIVQNSTEGFTTAPYGNWPQALTQYGWDFFHVQPFDRDIDSDVSSFKTFIDSAIQMSGSNLLPFLYQRWPRKRTDGNPNDGAYFKSKWDSPYVVGSFDYEKRAFFDQLCVAIRQQETRVKPILLVPVAEIMYKINDLAMAGNFPGLTNAFDLYTDGIHLGSINTGIDNGFVGSYIAAATFYCAITYRRLQNNTIPSGFGTISNSTRDLINNLIWDTVTTYQYTNNIPVSDATKPIAGLNASATEISVGTSVDFRGYALSYGNGTGILGYDWEIISPGGTTLATSVSNNPSYSFTSTGKHKVTLRIMNENNLYSDKVDIYVLVS